MRLIFLLLMLLVLPNLAHAEVKILTLQHRPAEDLLQPIRELLDEGEKAQAAGNHLVLIADGESLTAAIKLAELLDQPLTAFVIRVKQEERSQLTGQQLGATTTYSTRDQLTGAVTVQKQLGNSNKTNVQLLRVLEGEVAWIEIGRDIPYTSEWAATTGETTGYAERVEYKTIATGFWVRPQQAVSDKVLVDIEPQISSMQQYAQQRPGEVHFSRLRTRIQIPSGTWYPLGQQLRHADQLSRAIISYGNSTGQQDLETYIRIDPAEGFSP